MLPFGYLCPVRGTLDRPGRLRSRDTCGSPQLPISLTPTAAHNEPQRCGRAVARYGHRWCARDWHQPPTVLRLTVSACR
jgi:hypothetical protein